MGLLSKLVKVGIAKKLFDRFRERRRAKKA